MLKYIVIFALLLTNINSFTPLCRFAGSSYNRKHYVNVISHKHEKISAVQLQASSVDVEGSSNEKENLPVVNKSEEEDEDDDDDDEWEYEEFEILTNEDFYGSEWKVGTLKDKQDKIEETWVRLLQEGDQAIWGDGAKGTWNLDVPNQFLSVSKETFGGWGGKKIWACQLDDFYYLEGTVRGWAPWQAANVFAQWQARRLNVDKEEAGVAPWFERMENPDDGELEESSETDEKETEESKDGASEGVKASIDSKLEEDISKADDVSEKKVSSSEAETEINEKEESNETENDNEAESESKMKEDDSKVDGKNDV